MTRPTTSHRRPGPVQRAGTALYALKRRLDRWVAGHVPTMQVAIAVLGVLLVASSLVVSFGGGGGTSTLAERPPTPPSPSAPATSDSSSASDAPEVTLPSTSTSTSKSTSAAPKIECGASVSRGAGGSVPVHICIPEIGVDADVMQLGLNADRTVEVPPLSEVGLAGWYKYSPAPGVIGPSIILGHVDSAEYGKGVFFDLGKLQQGDMFSLTRADDMVAKFRVDKVEQFPKSEFPTQTVYGNTSNSQIRLITCGGQFDASAGNYLDNIIAFGTLVSLTKAKLSHA